MKKDSNQVMKEFHVRQSRQIVAVAIALFLVLLCGVVYKRSDLFGAFSKGRLFGAQIACIAAYIGFTSFNWRCPACDRHLGHDLFRRRCKKCGARLR
jgi:hypothetical protein